MYIFNNISKTSFIKKKMQIHPSVWVTKEKVFISTGIYSSFLEGYKVIFRICVKTLYNSLTSW